ncbi:MAG: tetratricopeptide repeat protein [Methanothrix sp.]|nr:tetratricopeptide repeat protein [Methanothrix sp.]
MTDAPNFDQKGQSVTNQTNIYAEKMVSQPCSASAFPIPQQIPIYPHDFTGREDEIKILLEQFGQGATITGLRGMGGVGKTALALVLADRLKISFPDGQLFLNMQGTSKSTLQPEEAMAHVIRSYLGADAPLPKDLNGICGLYRSVLSGKKAIILLDNAASREQVESLLPPQGCALLVTSRKKFALPGLAEKDLDVLPLEDAKKLLLEICGRIGDHARELAEICGRLPIALRNAASILRERPNLSVADYIKRLGDAKKRLELVDASFSTSYDLLTPELQRLWSLLSVFPADFDLAGAAAIWEVDEMPAEDALGELIRWSLVDFLPDAQGEGGRCRLHDLARDFASSWPNSADLDLAGYRHARYYQEMLWKADNLFLQGDASSSLKQVTIDWKNIEAGQKWASKNKFKNNNIAAICVDFVHSESILYSCLRPTKYIQWLEDALDSVRLLNDKRGEAIIINIMGNCYLDLFEINRSIEYYQKALDVSREIGDKIIEGHSIGNLGSAYCELGDVLLGINHFQKSLDISLETKDIKAQELSYGNLGSAYDHLGDPSISLKYYEQALKVSQEISDKRGEGFHLFNLGHAYFKLGESHKAIKYYEQALNISREIKNFTLEADIQNSLGSAYHLIGEIHKAIKSFDDGLNISREIEYKRGEGISVSNLGRAYLELGETQKGIEYQKQSLKISCEMEDKAGRGKDLVNLGISHMDLGQTKETINYFENALKIFQEIGDKYSEADVLGNLGAVYHDIGQLFVAIECYEQALKICRCTKNKNSEGNILGNISQLFFNLNEFSKSIEYGEKSLKIHLQTGNIKGKGIVLFNMGLSFHKLHQGDKASKLAKEALAIFEQIGSPYADEVRKVLAKWNA